MLRRFSSGMVPLKCKKQAQLVPAFVTTFRRANLSLASCTSAELASVLVQNNIQRIKLYLQTVEKSSHVQEFCQLLDKKYLASSRRTFENWLELATRFQWIK